MNRTMEFISAFDGLKLRLRRDIIENARAVVVISHGRGAKIETLQYERISGGLEAAGYSTYFFDHRGHGESEGIRGYYSDFMEIVNDVNTVVELAKKENPDKKVFLFGNSMGGFAAETFGCMYPGKVDGIILSVSAAPGNTEVPEKPENMTEQIIIDKRGSTGEVELYDDVIVVTPSLAYNIGLGRNWLAKHYQEFKEPVLIVNGELDREGCLENALTFFKGIASKDKIIKFYGNVPHKLYGSYMGPEVIADTITWLNVRTEK